MRFSSLLDESEKYTRAGFLTIPISSEIVNGKKTKKPPNRSAPSEKWFSYNNKEVECLAIAMDSIKLCIGFDVDGIEGFNIFINKILNKLSPSLQNKINKTAHTKTP